MTILNFLSFCFYFPEFVEMCQHAGFHEVVVIEPRASYMIVKHFSNWSTTRFFCFCLIGAGTHCLKHDGNCSTICHSPSVKFFFSFLFSFFKKSNFALICLFEGMCVLWQIWGGQRTIYGVDFLFLSLWISVSN